MGNFISSVAGNLDNFFITDQEIVDRYAGQVPIGVGSNSNGEFGIGNMTQQTAFTTIYGGGLWKEIKGFRGNFTSGGIKTDGTLWLCGGNDNGELGDNTVTYKSSPVQTVAGGTNWRTLSTGGYHSLAIKTDGTLWSWGANSTGEVGDNSATSKSSPVQITGGGTTWKQISAGNGYSSAIKTDGTLWMWGNNSFGQLGTNDRTPRSSPIQTVSGGTTWKQVTCGNSNTGAIKTDGSLWMWGRNDYGQLGTNNVVWYSSPVQTVAGGTNWKSIQNTTFSSAAIKTDGTLWMWGYNANGELGVNDRTSRSSPVQTVAGGTNWSRIIFGPYTACGLKTDGSVWFWGYNTYYQFGNGNSTSVSSPIQTIGSSSGWKSVSIGNNLTFVLLNTIQN